MLNANHSYAGGDRSTQELAAIESHTKSWAPFSALLFSGYSTLAIGVSANHRQAKYVIAYVFGHRIPGIGN